jgi:hypothetical protein
MSQVTVGFQLGGQAYSQIIFFQDAQSLKQFTSGNFEFGAEASAVAITAGANAKANTSGSSAGASATKNKAANVGAYNKGMATFTVAKGGLMYEASIGGQKFNYNPRLAGGSAGEGALRHGRSRMDSQRALPAALAVTLTAVSCIGRETQAGIR